MDMSGFIEHLYDAACGAACWQDFQARLEADFMPPPASDARGPIAETGDCSPTHHRPAAEPGAGHPPAPAPNLQTVWGLYHRLQRAEALAQACQGVLDGLPMGVVLLDAQATALYANAQAQALAQGSGLIDLAVGRGVRGKPALGVPCLHLALQTALAADEAMPHELRASMRLRGAQGRQLQLLVVRLPGAPGRRGLEVQGAAFLSDPGAPLPWLEQALRSHYRLSPAEAGLAQGVVSGLSLREYAVQRGISIHTARSQFKAAAAKLGVGRQADFVRTILTGPAMLRWNA